MATTVASCSKPFSLRMFLSVLCVRVCIAYIVREISESASTPHCQAAVPRRGASDLHLFACCRLLPNTVVFTSHALTSKLSYQVTDLLSGFPAQPIVIVIIQCNIESKPCDSLLKKSNARARIHTRVQNDEQ